ncbi:hypothetical protein LY01_02436 [Nonlabens xylanidelens]|uniref:Uncharacterized protein n=1 Tax=Nonlabens xylanidelens TaxID=191564 RepID=A0A2S6IHG4_9FLAO|nr:hypothetical protein [Nonlabens xylanidelens]PPK93653.1 hypothetical protein LY01_02436 [Nonlabens xylanidelens]PQJ17766.1 hypothetical protein BST94_12090 [Nonlabens xylanidelens]
MKYIILIITALVTSNAFAQKTFFENIKAKGENPVYIEYPGVSTDNKGEQMVDLSQERVGQYNEPREVIVKLLKHEGIDSGIAIIDKNDTDEKGSQYIADFTKNRHTFTGFPNTYIVYENVFNEGYVAIGNYIFFIDHFNSRTEFGDINRVYVLKGTTPDGEASSKTKKKKSGFGKFLNKAKNIALNNSAGPDPRKAPEYKAISKENVREMISDYLTAMREKQIAYTLTSKDEADLATMQKEADAYSKYIKDKNNAYWNSPEGQKTLRGWKLADEHKSSCRLTASSCTNIFH